MGKIFDREKVYIFEIIIRNVFSLINILAEIYEN